MRRHSSISGHDSENWCYIIEALSEVTSTELLEVVESLGVSEAEKAVGELVRRVLAVRAS